MPYVLDESSYRIDRNHFPSKGEAQDRAAECARILGRSVSVYELVGQKLLFAFRVLPDGKIDKTNPLVDHKPIEPESPVIVGQALARLDEAAEFLENAGRFDLAAAVDRAAAASQETTGSVDDGLEEMAAKLLQRAAP
jgi:hypothetical protein